MGWLAPGSQRTLDEFRDPALRPRRLTEPIPPDVFPYQPRDPLVLDPLQLLTALRRAGRWSAPDLSGMRYEHIKTFVEDDDMWRFLRSWHKRSHGRASQQISLQRCGWEISRLSRKIRAGSEVLWQGLFYDALLVKQLRIIQHQLGTSQHHNYVVVVSTTGQPYNPHYTSQFL